MVVRRAGGEPDHRSVRDLPELLRPGDLLVLNSTRVLPARFRGIRADSGGKVDGLYLGPALPVPPTGCSEPVGADVGDRPRWLVLLKCRRTKPGVIVRLDDRAGRPTDVSLRLIERQHEGDNDTGGWMVALFGSDRSAPEVLERIGLTPLPPYIRQARKAAHDDGDDAADRADYQTVFAHGSTAGSVAAPTAGLHFTPELLATLRDRGIRTAEVALHVGLGTFKPVEAEFVEQHPMHAEWCSIPGATAGAIDQTRSVGGRIIAVGTTSARTLESFPDAVPPTGCFEPVGADVVARPPIVRGTDFPERQSVARSGWTRLLITPGHRWRRVDGLMTNFHLPRSTLLAMTAAMIGDDQRAVDRLKSLYKEAMDRTYRFYSFGDAMLILP